MIPLNTKLDQHCYGGRGEGVIIYLDSLIFIETKTFYTKFPFSNIMHLVVVGHPAWFLPWTSAFYPQQHRDLKQNNKC